MMKNFVFVNNTRQLSSHNCPTDMSDVFVRFGKTKASHADLERIVCRGRMPSLVAFIVALFGKLAVGPSTN